MKKQNEKISEQKGIGACVWLRAMCIALCVGMMLLTLVGCDSYATQEEVSILKEKLENALDALDAVGSDYDSSKEEIDALKEENSLSKAEIDALKEENSASKGEIDALKGANGTAQAEIDSLKNSNATSNQKIEQLEEKLANAEAQIGMLEGNDVAKDQEISSLVEENASMQGSIDSLESDQEALLREIESLKAQIQELQSNATPEPEPDPVEKIKIYIDQGHNPTSNHNAGAQGNGLYEENLTFTVGKLLEELLEADGRFEVRLSRPTAYTVLGEDNSSSLDARVQGAVDFGADYFISLHTNAFDSDTVQGIEVHVAEEGSASFAFGAELLQGMLASTGLHDRGMKISPDLRVLKNAAMPAALLEMGFITNAEDASMLSQNPDRFAKGIYKGILSYFDLEPST